MHIENSYYQVDATHDPQHECWNAFIGGYQEATKNLDGTLAVVKLPERESVLPACFTGAEVLTHAEARDLVSSEGWAEQVESPA